MPRTLTAIVWLFVTVGTPVFTGLTQADVQATPSPSPSPSLRRRAPTVDALQGMRALDELKGTAEQLGALVERTTRKRYVDCLLAFGDEEFCGCLRDRLPAVASFDMYVAVVTSTKEERASANLTQDRRQLVEAVLSGREACVAEHVKRK